MTALLKRSFYTLTYHKPYSMKQKLTFVLLSLAIFAKAQTAARYDVVIDEIMADPLPVVGLPNAAFIELKNVSAQAVNLNGWQIGDAAGFATISTNFILQPDSFVVICTNTTAPAMKVFGAAIGVNNFPSLDNDGDQLYLRSKEGRFIHAVNYSAAWYQNAIKNQGGWSLEMIDTKTSCSGMSNWTSSNDPKGGTPGKKNSVDAINKDTEPPVLVNAVARDSVHIILTFDEPLDSAQLAAIDNYTITGAPGPVVSAAPIAPAFNKVVLKTAGPLERNKAFGITVTNMADCAGNPIGAYNKAKFGRAVDAGFSDIAINELLFNPRPDGADYVELYNRSNNIIDIKDCYISSRNANAAVGPAKQLSADNRLLFPGDYIVITADAAAVKRQYLAKNPAAFAEISSMPSLPDDKGDVLILNAQGKLIDELSYDAHWHFKLIDNDEGVALERIDYNQPAQDAANWHSAATSAGYGTPGYQNSQYKTDVQLPGNISLTPAVFSPDNDGFDDFLTINYQFPAAGYVCNITVFDANGRPVRFVTRNALCGLQGYFRWDGLDEKSARLPVGVYVVLAEVFNLQGKTKQFRQAVTLARRLN